MNKQEQEIIDSMFQCEKLNARITPQTCINNQTKNPNIKHYMKIQKKIPCANCEEGIKRLPGYKGQEIESKTCEAFKKNPVLCHGNPDGIFFRKFEDHKVNWERKEFCNENCRRSAYNTIVKRTVDYFQYDFCLDVNCKMLIQHKCILKDPKNCIFTAKEFHKWLTKNKFDIKRMKSKDEAKQKRKEIL